ncbi:hexaprenyldihydroxybenzoate methyltransferase mitochondrial precursor [Nadsonia fulvescens var. elongata DSM 6958]|uniref:Ubiquinone biosynthesis O-methyltransferase, mitochondrial n=1 Tax=Nadsonia fulvescens var. elongata DSM 6958 TaxID=857566 RepID=A0A1E3PQL6_9ASCO|nr:hexaprenyldihydroxybenzoate methyltransferase mitochondrial precursor [Nadsonia fulvescens var. elongata DSM 6958]
MIPKSSILRQACVRLCATQSVRVRFSTSALSRYSSTPAPETSGATSTSAEELKHFNELADSWWDVHGSQRILHKMNQLRMDFIVDTIKRYNQKLPGYSLDLLPPVVKQELEWDLQDEEDRLITGKNSSGEAIQKFNVLDVGCGGGILSESLARLGFISHVKGIDLSCDVLEYAKKHMNQDLTLKGKLDYHLTELEGLPKGEKYDMVTMMEMLEHVDMPAEILKQGIDRVKPGGWLFLSTINRTPISWFTTIFMGEHILKIVPTGTHTYSKYINEEELREWFEQQPDWELVKSAGCLYIPMVGWKLAGTSQMGNYIMALKKKASATN